MAAEATGLSATVAWIAGYAVNSAWQVPVMLMTGLAAARLARPMGQQVVYRVWVGTLLAAVALPAVAASGWDVGSLAAFGAASAWSAGWAWLHGAESASGGSVRVALSSGFAGSAAGLHWAVGAVWALGVVYAGSVLVGAARLLHGLARVRRLCRAAVALPADALVDRGLDGRAALPRDLRIGEAGAVAGPMVVGMRPAWLLLPTGFMERVSAEDARAAVAHELAHVRRGDFGKNLICRVLALPVSYHPCAWAMQARLAESREMACDALAAEQVGGPGRYARSLLRLAAALPDALPGSIQGSQQTAGLAVGMLEGNRLERRVVQMMQTRKELNGMAKAAVMAGLLLMTAGAGATVGGMHLRVQGDVEGAHPPSGKILTVPGRVMAGNSLPKVNPTYPASAKHDKVQGTVILAMRIDKEGVPTDVRVQKGVRADLDESALTAVRKWRYKPYLLNGAPTEVETTVRVTYSLEK